MYLREQKLLLIVFMIILLCSCIISVAHSEEIKSPICPIVYGVGDGGFELYWFYPDKNRLSVGNNTIVPERGVIPSMDDRQYAIFTTINLTPPYYIESTNTYIKNSDMYPDLPGDQFTPLRLSVKKKESGNYYNDLWYEYVSLYPDADFSGAIVEAVTDLGVDDLFDIYLALEWLPGTPTSPMVGVNSLPPYLYQTICPMDDSSYQAVYTTACAMVGAKVLSWHTTSTKINKSKNENLVNYELLYSEDSTNIFSGSKIIASVGSDSLTANFNLTQSGYITVKAINDEGESYSDILFLDKDKLPPVTVRPQKISIDRMVSLDNNKIVLENSGPNNLELSLYYDRSLFVLSSNLIILESGTNTEITVEFKGEIDSFDQINSPIIIKTTGDYYPLIMHVTVLENGQTSVDNDELILPEEFKVGRPYPNPFNSSVRFSLAQPNQKPVQMDIYNLLGQNVFSQVLKPIRRQSVVWNGIDNMGQNVGSGIYFIRFSTDETVVFRKAVLLK